MNSEEIQSLIKQLKAAGLSEEQIMDVFYKTFQKGEMDREDLETLANAMGFELTDDFKNDPTPDPIAAGSTEEAAEGGISQEEAEEAKAIEPGETAEEFKEKIDEIKDGESGPEASEEEEGAAEPSEPEEAEKPEEEKEESTAEGGEETSESEEGEEKEEAEEEDDEAGWEKAQKLFRI